MSFSLIFAENCEKLEAQFLRRHPDMLGLYHKTLVLLERDPVAPALRLHPLKGQLAGLHAVSINLQHRITLEMEIREKEIILISVGSHGEAN